MKLLLVIALAGFVPAAVLAQDQPAEPVAAELGSGTAPLAAADVDLADFVWTRRPLVVFADNPADPAYIQQMLLLAEDAAALAERDVVLIVDTDPAARTALRQKLRPRGFSLVWIDKDGSVRLRKPSPWTVREIVQAIDKTPLRLEEIGKDGS